MQRDARALTPEPTWKCCGEAHQAIQLLHHEHAQHFAVGLLAQFKGFRY